MNHPGDFSQYSEPDSSSAQMTTYELLKNPFSDVDLDLKEKLRAELSYAATNSSNCVYTYPRQEYRRGAEPTF